MGQSGFDGSIKPMDGAPSDSITGSERQSSIALRGITKRFGLILANDKIDLDIFGSEIHALLGENGAGKSTLMKILYGVYRADSGEISMNGSVLSVSSPRDARNAGIGMVFQDLNLISALSVAENIALYLPDLKFFLSYKDIAARIAKFSKEYGLDVDPLAIVSDLSIGEQQKVELVKLLISNARVLILDEPTRVLASHEVGALFAVLHKLRNAGYAIILITHKMSDVFECADRITVLKSGKKIKTLPRENASENTLVNMMFDTEISDLKIGAKVSSAGTPVLELMGGTAGSQGSRTALNDIRMNVAAGEIVGIAGVSGNGQRELCDLILGVEPGFDGTKHVNGKVCTRASVREMRNLGVRYIPENPLELATVPYMSVVENMVLTNSARYARRSGFSMDRQTALDDIDDTSAKLGISVDSQALAVSLSGGNLQRMVILRELARDPLLIIASYLTRGLDMKSAMAARQALVDARNSGVAIILISEDLDELFTLSDRILVLYGGSIVGEKKPTETTIQEIGYLMTGSRAHGVA